LFKPPSLPKTPLSLPSFPFYSPPRQKLLFTKASGLLPFLLPFFTPFLPSRTFPSVPRQFLSSNSFPGFSTTPGLVTPGFDILFRIQNGFPPTLAMEKWPLVFGATFRKLKEFSFSLPLIVRFFYMLLTSPLSMIEIDSNDSVIGNL